MIRRVLFSFCTLALIASAARAQLDPLVYDNGVVPNTALASQLDTVYPFESGVADEFILPSDSDGDGLPDNIMPTQITGVAFTGQQFNDPPDLPNPADFQIDFYRDNGAGTAPAYTGDGTTSPKPDAIFSTIINLTAPEPSPGPYSYAAKFDGPVLEKDTTYWISIKSLTQFPPQFGWQGDNSSGTAVQGFPLLGIPYWTPVGAEMDFQLYGEKIPEPATGQLLLLGLAGMGFCRRR